MSIERLLFLQEQGYLTEQKNALLDIGPQNVYSIPKPRLQKFVATHGSSLSDTALDEEIERLVYFSTPRPDERTTLLSEITDLVGIDYNSFDVCPGLKTEIVDLNFDRLEPRHAEKYDVVLNFGTSEHVFNQWNCFGVMHDALKVGGIIYCHIQVTGSLEHGYYFYTPQFFRDMAAANGYRIEHLFLAEAGFYTVGKLNVDIRMEDTDSTPAPFSATRNPDGVLLPAYNIHVVLKKLHSAPFRCGLEIATAHSALDSAVSESYGDGSEMLDRMGRLQREVDAMRGSRSWRLTAPLRAALSWMRRA